MCVPAHLEKLSGGRRKGWESPGTRRMGRFQLDFGVTIDESVPPGEYNFRSRAEYEAMGSNFSTTTSR